MALIYADTSVLFAYFYPRDVFSTAVTEVARAAAVDFVYWPMLRLELRHNLRLWNVDRDGATAWAALRAGEKTAARLRWQNLSADDLIDAADELSAEKKPACGTADILHIVAARRMLRLSELDEFWTCDETQAALAKQVGLTTRLFKAPSRPDSRRTNG